MDEQTTQPDPNNPFDAETWALLPSYFDQLPNPVQINLWGDPQMSLGEREAARLCHALAERFEQITYRILPRRINYDYYPVFGMMGKEGDGEVDYGVRIIGNPAGYQLTSLIAAIQAVSFRGVTLEPKTRLMMRGLDSAVALEIVSAADNESGALVAKNAFGLSVANPHIRTYLIMGDVFEEAMIQYSVTELPHIVINNRYHVSGLIESEEALVEHIAKAVKK